MRRAPQPPARSRRFPTTAASVSPPRQSSFATAVSIDRPQTPTASHHTLTFATLRRAHAVAAESHLWAAPRLSPTTPRLREPRSDDVATLSGTWPSSRPRRAQPEPSHGTTAQPFRIAGAVSATHRRERRTWAPPTRRNRHRMNPTAARASRTWKILLRPIRTGRSSRRRLLTRRALRKRARRSATKRKARA